MRSIVVALSRPQEGAGRSRSHDPQGQLVERTTPAGERTRFGWREGLLSSVDGGGGAASYEADDGLESIIDAEGTRITAGGSPR